MVAIVTFVRGVVVIVTLLRGGKRFGRCGNLVDGWSEVWSL